VPYSGATVSILWLITAGEAVATVSSAPASPPKSGISTSITVSGELFLHDWITFAKWLAPPSLRSSRVTDVITAYLSPSSLSAAATLPGSVGSAGGGKPWLTLQKRQLRVHIVPRMIKVAVFCAKHSI
jgi:hypothetical protein